MQTSRSTLNAYYELVRPLREHLAAILRDYGDVNASIVLEEPSPAYEDLVDTCVVAVNAAPEKWPVYVPSPPMMAMKEVRVSFQLAHPILTSKRSWTGLW
jgi:hypothetical protein